MSATIPAGSLRPVRNISAVLGGDLAGVEISFTDRDRTRPFLVLHSGGGAATVAGFADLLAEHTHSRVLVPTHPGFGGAARAAALTSTRDLAAGYFALLDSST